MISFFDPSTQVIDASYETANCCQKYCSNQVFCKYTCYSRCCGEFNDTSPRTAPNGVPCAFYFDSHFSSTYVKNGSSIFERDCDLGRICGSGFAGMDAIELIDGKLRIEDVLFGQLNIPYFRGPFPYSVAQLGLGLSSDDILIGQEPILFRIAKRSNISTLFSMWLSRTNEIFPDSGSLDGEISFGAVNDLKCGTPVYYDALSIVPLDPRSDLGQGYVVPLNAIQWSTYFLTLPDGQHFNLSLAPYNAVPVVVGSQIVMDQMVQAVGAKVMNDGFGTIVMDCDKIPPIDFTLNGTSYRVPANRFSGPYGATKQCVVSIQVVSGVWALGSQFLQEFCLVVDYDHNRIGLGDNLIGILP